MVVFILVSAFWAFVPDPFGSTTTNCGFCPSSPDLILLSGPSFSQLPPQEPHDGFLSLTTQVGLG